MLEERKILLAASPEAKKWLCDEGYDSVYGARPLKRLIQRKVLNPLAKLLLDGSVAPHDTVLLEKDPTGGVVLLPQKSTTPTKQQQE